MTERTLEELKRDLEKDFKIDDYLKLRRQFPHDDTFVPMFCAGPSDRSGYNGHAYLNLLVKEFIAFGISDIDYYMMLEGRVAAIDSLCLGVLGAISKREKALATFPHAIANGTVIGDALIAHLIVTMVEYLSIYKHQPPDSFQVLLKVFLGIHNNDYRKTYEVDKQRQLAAHLVAERPNLSIRRLAGIIGVNPSTVSRWMKDEDFKRRVALYRYCSEQPDGDED